MLDGEKVSKYKFEDFIKGRRNLGTKEEREKSSPIQQNEIEIEGMSKE